MADMIVPYDPAHFNDTGSFRQACEPFEAKGGDSLIDYVLMPLFGDYEVQSKLDLGLLQSHFDIKDDETLVEQNEVSVAWKRNTV